MLALAPASPAPSAPVGGRAPAAPSQLRPQTARPFVAEPPKEMPRGARRWVPRRALLALPAVLAAPTAAAVLHQPATPGLAAAATLAVVAPAMAAAQCSRQMVAAPGARVDHALFYASAATALGVAVVCLGRGALRPLVLDCYWSAVCLIVLPQILQSAGKGRPAGRRLGHAPGDARLVRDAAIVALAIAYLVARVRREGVDGPGGHPGAPAGLQSAASPAAHLALDLVCPLVVRATFPGLYAEAQAPRVRRVHARHWTARAAVGATAWTANAVLPYGVYRAWRAWH